MFGHDQGFRTPSHSLEQIKKVPKDTLFRVSYAPEGIEMIQVNDVSGVNRRDCFYVGPRVELFGEPVDVVSMAHRRQIVLVEIDFQSSTHELLYSEEFVSTVCRDIAVPFPPR